MKSIDTFLSGKSTALTVTPETPRFPQAANQSDEPFDSLVDRALAGPARPPDEYNSPLKKSAQDPQPAKPAKPETNAPRPAKAAPRPDASADNPARITDAGTPAAAPAVKDESSAKRDSNPDAPATAAAAAITTDPMVLAQQALAATAGEVPLVPVPTAANNSSGTGSPNPGGAVNAVSTSGSAALAGTMELSGKDSSRAVNTPAGKGKEMPAGKSDPAKTSASADGAVPVTALFGKAEKVNETPANAENPAAIKPLSAAAETNGMSAAQQAATMNKADTADKVAGTPEQNLPGVTVISAAQSAIHARPAARTAARVEAADAPAAANVASADRPAATSETSSSSPISASSQTELRLRALDRTHDIVALQGMRLKESNASSLSVVIKPGAGVQMSLQLQQTAGGIQAQAVLQQGDYQQLKQHWSDLQQRLEERGIKLAPLTQEQTAMNSGGENFQRNSQQSPEQNPLSAGAFAEFVSAGAAARPVPATAAASRGWESWA